MSTVKVSGPDGVSATTRSELTLTKVGSKVFLDSNDAELKTIIDEPASGNTTYIGKAAPGSDSSDAVWQIKRVTESATITTIEHADSDIKFDNIWDLRTTLTYG